MPKALIWNDNPTFRRFAVFALSALVLFLTMSRAANIFDEGIIYGGAMRVLAGQLVHRDFYSVYGPASYTILAGAFTLTGPSFLVGRLLGVATVAAAVTIIHAMLESRTRPAIALAVAALATLWLLIQPPSYLAPMYPCMTLALGGAAILLKPDALRRTGALIGAGAICGIAAYFRYDAGFFILVAYALGAVLVLTRALPGKPGRDAALRAVLTMGLAAAAVFAPGAAYYLTHAPFAAFRHDIIDYTVQYYGRMRGLPFPRPHDLRKQPELLGIYLPLIIIAAAIPALREDWRKLRGTPDRIGPVNAPATIVLALLAGVLYYKGTVRVSTLHMMISLVPAIALAGLVLERWTARGGMARWAARGGAALLVGVALLALRDPIHLLRINPGNATLYWLAERAHLVHHRPDAEEDCPAWPGMAFAGLDRKYAVTAYYLARHTAPTDKVLVGLGQTDRVMINPMLLNYAANRLPGTHWSQFDPGLQNRSDIQQQMVGELTANDVRWIVRDTSFDGYKEPNGSSWHSGVHLLDQTIDGHYRPVGHSEGVSLWLRKDVPAPDASGDPAACRLDAVG